MYRTMRTNEAVAALAALAQESRLQVWSLLVRHGEAGLLAGRPQQFQLRLRRNDDTFARMSFSIRPLLHDHNDLIARFGVWQVMDKRR